MGRRRRARNDWRASECVVETEVGKAAAAAAYHVRRVYGLPASRAWEVRPGSNFPCTGADEAGLPGGGTIISDLLGDLYPLAL